MRSILTKKAAKRSTTLAVWQPLSSRRRQRRVGVRLYHTSSWWISRLVYMTATTFTNGYYDLMPIRRMRPPPVTTTNNINMGYYNCHTAHLRSISSSLTQIPLQKAETKISVNSNFKTWMSRLEQDDITQSETATVISTVAKSSTNDDPTNENRFGPAKNLPPQRRRPAATQQYPPLPVARDFPEWSYDARDFFRYELIHQSSISQARVGRIHTPHGIIETPAFVAVATNAALKGIDFQQLSSMTTTSSSPVDLANPPPPRN